VTAGVPTARSSASGCARRTRRRFFFQDGGNCFSAAACAPDYEPGLTIQHKGYVNGTAALDHLAATFPSATEVVVMGESAGSVAAPRYAGLVSDRLPDARITVVANGSGGTPDLPDDTSRRMFDAWGLADVDLLWAEDTGVTAEQWSVPGLFIQSGRYDPSIVFARVDYADDARQQLGFPLFAVPAGDLLSVIDAYETQVEGAGVNLPSYVAPGDDHSALSTGRFYTETQPNWAHSHHDTR
jgi:hypothetical protein